MREDVWLTGHFLRESYWWGKSDRLWHRSVFRIGIGGRKIGRSRLEPWMGLLGTANPRRSRQHVS